MKDSYSVEFTFRSGAVRVARFGPQGTEQSFFERLYELKHIVSLDAESGKLLYVRIDNVDFARVIDEAIVP